MADVHVTLVPGQKSRLLSYLVMGVAFVLLPPFFPSYVQSQLTKVFIFAIFAMSLDLSWGYTGLISLGHAAYFGTAGYAVGILTIHYGVDSLWVTAPIGIVAAGLMAALFGLIALRVSGAYFLLITTALGQLLFSVAWKWRALSSEGTEGIVGISRPSLGLPGFTWDFTSFYYFVILAFVICFLILYRLVRSPFGYALQGIREDEKRMRAIGYNVWLHKYIVFIIAGVFAGVAGVLFVYHNGVVVPEDLAIGTSVLALLMVVIGGVGTLYGPAIGAAVIIPLEFFIGIMVPERWPLVLGIVFVFSIMRFRQGIGVYLLRSWKRMLPG